MTSYDDLSEAEREQIADNLMAFRLYCQRLKEDAARREQEATERFYGGLSNWLLENGYDSLSGAQIIAEIDELVRLGYEYQQKAKRERAGG